MCFGEAGRAALSPVLVLRTRYKKEYRVRPVMTMAYFLRSLTLSLKIQLSFET
jgi:hypothetical protein